jgi:hypothetical protein
MVRKWRTLVWIESSQVLEMFVKFCTRHFFLSKHELCKLEFRSTIEGEKVVCGMFFSRRRRGMRWQIISVNIAWSTVKEMIIVSGHIMRLRKWI